jgi:hypothetical protein
MEASMARQSTSKRSAGVAEDQANRSRQQSSRKPIQAIGQRDGSSTDTVTTQRLKTAGAVNSSQDAVGKARRNQSASAGGKGVPKSARPKTAVRKASESGIGPKSKKISPKKSTPAAREMRRRTGGEVDSRH